MTVQEAIKNVTAYVYMECENMPQQVIRALDVLKDSAKECEQYRALGTVEELKEAREKQVAKKPIDNGMRSGIFATHKYYSCPRCGNACLQKMANERQNTNYCWDCGQALKWGEEND